MRFTVIGFCTEFAKATGIAQRLADLDVFETDTIPTEIEMRRYCEERGYLDRPTPRCDPVYFCHEPAIAVPDAPNPFKPPRAMPASDALARFLERHQGRRQHVG